MSTINEALRALNRLNESNEDDFLDDDGFWNDSELDQEVRGSARKDDILKEVEAELDEFYSEYTCGARYGIEDFIDILSRADALKDKLSYTRDEAQRNEIEAEIDIAEYSLEKDYNLSQMLDDMIYDFEDLGDNKYQEFIDNFGPKSHVHPNELPITFTQDEFKEAIKTIWQDMKQHFINLANKSTMSDENKIEFSLFLQDANIKFK